MDGMHIVLQNILETGTIDDAASLNYPSCLHHPPTPSQRLGQTSRRSPLLAAQQYCMKEFKDFIVSNRIDYRDSLLQLNSAIESKRKQPQLVDQIFEIASRVVQLDLSEQIDGATDSKLIDANSAKDEEITAASSYTDTSPVSTV